MVHTADIAETPVSRLSSIFRDQDAVINTAGMVTEGAIFVALVDHILAGLESLPGDGRPVCWFMAGAALLDLDETGRRAVDLQPVASTYWPHRDNFDRIRRTALDWRLLCPGPMVDQPALGLARMRVSLDRLPVEFPATMSILSEQSALPLFISRMPEMIVSYADAAALMLANITPGDEMSRHRVGLALPIGMRGEKNHPAAKGNVAV